MHKLCIITTVPASIKAFYQGQIESLSASGIEVTVMCANDSELKNILPNGTAFLPIAFTRISSPLQDLKALWQLYRKFRSNRFDLVQYSTPKASLLGSIAAWAAGVPVRIYILWGLYYTGQDGLERKIYKSLEKLICSLSTHVVPISHEMIDFADSEGLVKKQKCTVMLNGSACGVDLESFDPDKWRQAGREIRNNYHIPEHATVVGSVARLTGDKGINELVEAFDEISAEIPGLYLLLVGEQEQKDRLLPTTESIINRNNRIRVTGWQSNPLPYYAAMDVFCLPTYREGFGEVNLEAQAMGLPVISTDVIGPRESVEKDVTGFLVEPRSKLALIEPLKILIKDPALRTKMGGAGRARVIEKFDRKSMIQTVVQHRLALLREIK